MKAIKPISPRAVQVELGEPVVVSRAAPGEATWGYFQFPTLSRLPGGELLLTVNNTHDDDLCYGHAGPAWVSFDDGKKWRAADLDEKALTISHSPVTEVHGGDFICLPMPAGIKPGDMPKEALGQSVGRFYAYCWRAFHPLKRFPKPIQEYFQNIHGLRWDAKKKQWDAAVTRWDMRGALVRVDEAGMVGAALSTTSLEYRPVRVGKELIDANYKIAYMHADGTPPRGFEVICMVSKDNGRSWKRRGLIARDPTGTVHPTDTSISLTKNGGLVCVCRTTDHRQLPMWVTHSRDGGRTWSEPQTLFKHGVLPTLELMGNGVLALSYGRPGVQMSFSPRGDGRQWTKPIDVLPSGLPKGKKKWKWEEIVNNAKLGQSPQRDGYTSMVPLSDDTLLLAYCDMAHVDERGRRRKAVLVRRITVRRGTGA